MPNLVSQASLFEPNPRLLVGIDPGAEFAAAVITNENTPKLLGYKCLSLLGMTHQWREQATVALRELTILLDPFWVDETEMPDIGIEWPVLGPSAASFGSQVAFAAALEMGLFMSGYPVAMHVHPLQSKRALTGTGHPVRRRQTKVSTKERKDPMVKMCRLMGLWPDPEPKTQAFRWALADAIGHAMALRHHLSVIRIRG